MLCFVCDVSHKLKCRRQLWFWCIGRCKGCAVVLAVHAAAQVLNGYVDALGRGGRAEGARLEFWVSEAGALARLEAELPPHGSLGPLFYAFGLISAEDLRSGAGTYATGALPQLDRRGLLVQLGGHLCLGRVCHR